MSPEQALDVLNRMCAATPATRQDHVNAIEAIRVLTEALAPKDE